MAVGVQRVEIMQADFDPVPQGDVGLFRLQAVSVTRGQPDRMAFGRIGLGDGEPDIRTPAEDQNRTATHSFSLSDCSEAKARAAPVSARMAAQSSARGSVACSVSADSRASLAR